MQTSLRFPTRIVMLLIRAYQLLLSPFMQPRCRFWPSCSEYGLQAFKMYGFWRGCWLTVRRLLRCHPFSRASGYDPVPDSQH